MKNILFILAISIFSLSGYTQSWNVVSPINVRSSEERKIIPRKFVLAQINDEEIFNMLKKAPIEDLANARNSNAEIKVMLDDQTIDEFRIVEYTMMEPGLANKYPLFKTYKGYSSSDPLRTIRIDHTLNGFRAVISDEKGKTYIDPYQSGDNNHRIIYKKSDIGNPHNWSCETISDYQRTNRNNQRLAGDCTLREYRIAVAATGEYTTFHGGTVAAGQAAIVTAMNRVNEIYEQDLSSRMILVANNDQLVYTNSGTDPYTNNDGNAMLSQNQTTVDNIIGNANYDIGHVFSTGGGGVAYLRSLCNNSNKAGGVTGQSSPTGDPFWIDYVCHEIGHQFGGNHTQNNSCNRNSATAVEPGSASTIMGYAGICDPNVQNNSDAYFHAISIQEMTAHITSDGNCGMNSLINNNPPVVVTSGNFTVPASTPLVLEASASDSDSGDVLTYCWEQMDNEVATMPPLSTNTGGPAFRSLYPSTDNKRYLPNINAIINNSTPTWEVLPSVSRTMDFRVTVRDHLESIGCTDEADMTITVDGNSGPFLVIDSSIPASVQEGQNITLQWDVAGTTSVPVSCSDVNIYMSVDGGLTYPTILATSVPNDGEEVVVIPAGTTTTARIMVRGAGNIFFDINNHDFTVIPGSESYTIALDPSGLEVCNDQSVQFTVNSTSISGYNTPINLSVSGGPPGQNVSFSTNPIIPDNSSIVTISNFSGNVGSYPIEVTGTSGSIIRMEEFLLSLVSASTTPNLISPADNATAISTSPTLSWSSLSNAQSYDYEVSSSPGGGGNIANGNTASTTLQLNGLSANTTYYWRIRSNNVCGSSQWSGEWSFTTELCPVFTASNLPVNIIDKDQSDVFIEVSGINGFITDVDVVNLSGTHTYVGDLFMAMFSPNGSEIQVDLFSQICGSNNDFDLGFDDEATSATIPCPPTTGDTYQPITPLSTWDGQDPNGIWQLGVLDLFSGDVGIVESMGLKICYNPVCELTVTSTAQTGPGTLLSAIECAKNGDVITLDPSLANQSIDLGNMKMIVDKNLRIEANLSDNITINYSGTGSALEIQNNADVSMVGIYLQKIAVRPNQSKSSIKVTKVTVN